MSKSFLSFSNNTELLAVVSPFIVQDAGLEILQVGSLKMYLYFLKPSVTSSMNVIFSSGSSAVGTGSINSFFLKKREIKFQRFSISGKIFIEMGYKIFQFHIGGIMVKLYGHNQ